MSDKSGEIKAPEMSQIQKAAEMLKVKKFSAAPAAAAVPAVPAAAPAMHRAEMPKYVPPAVQEVDFPIGDEPAVPPAASAPVAAASEVSRSVPAAAAVPTATPAGAPVAAPAATPARAPQASAAAAAMATKAGAATSGTVVDLAAQHAAQSAVASLPSDYAALKLAALQKAQAQMPAESRLALPAGTALQEYKVEWTLGVGGFGVTYLAMDTNLEMQVAIKEFFPGDLVRREPDGSVHVKQKEDEEAFTEGRDKFLLESRTLAKFNHPNVVKVSRFFQMNQTAYMVMNYESGSSFKEWLSKRGKMSEEQMLKMFLPLLDGLETVHKAGYLHRDIKPANIFVREDDSLVLLDFGAARQAIGNKSRSLTTIVTPGYAPFEQYHSHGKQGPWTDLYALGGVLYWSVSGSKPVEAPARIKTDAMAPASRIGAGRFSASLLAAVDWALVPDENKRPKSIEEFKRALTATAPVAVPAQAATPAKGPASKTLKMESKPPVPSSSDTSVEKKAWWKLGK